MRAPIMLCSLFLLIAVLGGCASADKRYNQGTEMEAKGRYEQAVMRYVQALEKDPDLQAARYRLAETGNMAIDEQLGDARSLIARSDPANAAKHYRRIDSVVARARSVGVRLDLPADYDSERQAVFHDAFEAVMAQAVMSRQQGRWQEGLNACRRARSDFEPDSTQRTRTLTEEATIYVQWSDTEYQRGHWRSAFDLAANVQNMTWSPVDQANDAAELMHHSLAQGEIELIVLPVQVRSGSTRRAGGAQDLAASIESVLWQGPWRQPPTFIVMHEALAARNLITHSGLLENNYNAATIALVLRLAEADLGAFVQLLTTETTEFDVRSATQKVKTKSGKATSFVREKGKRRLQATVRIVIADDMGNELTNVIVSGTGTARFARGVYRGDHRNLNLSSKQVDLFDRLILADQEQAAREKLVLDLTATIADAVFQPILAQIP